MKRELHEWFKQQKMQKAQSKAKARGSVAVNTQIHLGCLRQARTQSNFDLRFFLGFGAGAVAVVAVLFCWLISLDLVCL